MASSACEHPPPGRPLIGLTTYLEPTRYGIWDLEAALLPAVYVNAVTQAGGRPVLLPPVGTWDATEVADLDAVILTGGADVDPGRYGQQVLPTTAAQPIRDAPELALLAAAEAADPDAPFLLGVQWHPEENPADLRLVAALIDIASERRSACRSAAEPKESTCPLPTM